MIEPAILEGPRLRLEPLVEEHAAALWEVSQEQELYRFKPYHLTSLEDMRGFIAKARELHRNGSALSLATFVKDGNRIVGSSSFFNADPQHRRVEIGGTWVIPSWQRTFVNTEAKYLMLVHAFERLECIRVEFKTDSLNDKSRRALERIGAVQEGIFRNHMVMPDGRLRHSVYFSITVEEWPHVKRRLAERLREDLLTAPARVVLGSPGE